MHAFVNSAGPWNIGASHLQCAVTVTERVVAQAGSTKKHRGVCCLARTGRVHYASLLLLAASLMCFWLCLGLMTCSNECTWHGPRLAVSRFF
eukprot:2638660-Amphidinium_carterae.1